jgi:hypothetical protein
MSSLKQLVVEYNKMAAVLGRAPVKRFPNLATARRRLRALAREMPVELARIASVGVENMSLRQLTDSFNVLVNEMNQRGIPTRARFHTSLFESKALGRRQLRRLIEEARRAP